MLEASSSQRTAPLPWAFPAALAALAGLTAAFVGGCPDSATGRAGRGAGRSGGAASPEPAGTLGHTKIQFDIGGAPSPSPLVIGGAGGRRTAMIVDTGAESHVLAEWLAIDARLPTRAAVETGHDALGHAVTFSVVDRPALTLDGWPVLTDRPVVVTRVPAFFKDLGVGVILSPQLLATSRAAVVVDFGRLRLDAAPYDEAVRALAARGPALVVGGLRVCSDPRAVVDNLAYVVPGAAEGNTAAFVVDTGARVTTLFEDSPAAIALAARAEEAPAAAHGVAGSAPARTVKAVRLRVGEVERTLDVRIAPGPRDPACPFDALLGIDFLRSCALVLAPDRMAGNCVAPIVIPPAPASAPSPSP